MICRRLSRARSRSEWESPSGQAGVHVVDQLPKTRSSKVMRRVIRSVYCGLPAGDLSSLDNPSAIAAIERAAKH